MDSFPEMLYYIVCSIVPHFFIFVEKEASCLMQWKNASLKYESQTDRLILKVLTPNYANAVLNFQNRNRESFEAYEPLSRHQPTTSLMRAIQALSMLIA